MDAAGYFRGTLCSQPGGPASGRSAPASSMTFTAFTRLLPWLLRTYRTAEVTRPLRLSASSLRYPIGHQPGLVSHRGPFLVASRAIDQSTHGDCAGLLSSHCPQSARPSQASALSASATGPAFTIHCEMGVSRFLHAAPCPRPQWDRRKRVCITLFSCISRRCTMHINA